MVFFIVSSSQLALQKYKSNRIYFDFVRCDCDAYDAYGGLTHKYYTIQYLFAKFDLLLSVFDSC